jgi:hypothetical protein
MDRTRPGRVRLRSGVITLASTTALLCGVAGVASAEESTESATTSDEPTTTASGSGGTGGSKESGGDGSILLKAEAAAPDKAFFYGEQPVVYRYAIDGDRPRNLKIQAVRRNNWRVVKVWRREDVEPGTHKIRWTGRNRHGGAAKKGTYLFRIRTKRGSEVDRTRAKGDDRSFKLYPEKFPVRARHTYGDGFGAARSGHTHQGQDVFARCGKPLVAARGGRVQYRGNDPGRWLLPRRRRTLRPPRLRVHAHPAAWARQGRGARAHRRADRAGRPDRQRIRMPPPFRAVVEAGLVRGRTPDEVGDEAPQEVGPLELTGG